MEKLTKNRPTEPKMATSVMATFAAGALSGTCSTVILQPLDLMKTRIQQSPNSSLYQAAQVIYKTEGISGFWTGVTPSLWRTVPGIGLYFSSYHSLSSFVTADNQPLTSTQSLTIGTFSRVIAGSLLIPITVIKTRWEAGGDTFRYRGLGMISALQSIIRAEGPRGLVSGLVPTIVRDAPYSGIYLLFYNRLKQTSFVTDIHDPNTRSLALFLCGLVSGGAATVLVQPADVVKTELQLKQRRVTQLEVARTVLRERGPGGFMVGLVPRLIRKSLMSALSWAVYERVADQMLNKL